MKILRSGKIVELTGKLPSLVSLRSADKSLHAGEDVVGGLVHTKVSDGYC